MRLECMLIRLRTAMSADLVQELRQIGALAAGVRGLKSMRVFRRMAADWDLVLALDWSEEAELPSVFGQEIATRMKNYGILERDCLVEVSLNRESANA